MVSLLLRAHKALLPAVFHTYGHRSTLSIQGSQRSTHALRLFSLKASSLRYNYALRIPCSIMAPNGGPYRRGTAYHPRLGPLYIGPTGPVLL